VIVLLVAIGAAAGLYQLLALAAALYRLCTREQAATSLPPISILKPVHGLDPEFYAGIRSHALQDYPEFEILFGVSDPSDPAIAEIERLRAEFPARSIRLVVTSPKAANVKVGVLEELAAAARYPILLVNDSDIRVGADYLRRVVAPLEDPGVGLVTCLYRARSASWPGRFEALGIATDFAPSTLVARVIGVRESAFGSTMLFRAEDLARIGKFAALADYIADDYQLGRRIHDLGKRIVLARAVVETSLADRTWGEVWRHQLRWARTIRVSRGGGYAGLPLSNATLWSVALAAAGLWWVAVPLLLLRLAMAFVVGRLFLEDRRVLTGLLLVPLRDLAGMVLWACGLFGSKVDWRGARLRLSRDGKIVRT
jgi:ceramide glucosyltransferase